MVAGMHAWGDAGGYARMGMVAGGCALKSWLEERVEEFGKEKGEGTTKNVG
jgi:hypothetical protein